GVDLVVRRVVLVVAGGGVVEAVGQDRVVGLVVAGRDVEQDLCVPLEALLALGVEELGGRVGADYRGQQGREVLAAHEVPVGVVQDGRQRFDVGSPALGGVRSESVV